ncbi:unknown (plasmid) [Haloarcula marismortui ATCC 43049]|uniref:Uncharacterized protein n=2 Tax=Haloarcula marismortui (strain ATCC 43049 / DSM 3752 / JCM 8966 / VKM B-1809) TaxID=272569 RepID=Q5V6Y4_HALMA|nr:unknown [Haloarcula marismortui ATCC 43049]
MRYVTPDRLAACHPPRRAGPPRGVHARRPRRTALQRVRGATRACRSTPPSRGLRRADRCSAGPRRPDYVHLRGNAGRLTHGTHVIRHRQAVHDRPGAGDRLPGLSRIPTASHAVTPVRRGWLRAGRARRPPRGRALRTPPSVDFRSRIRRSTRHRRRDAVDPLRPVCPEPLRIRDVHSRSGLWALFLIRSRYCSDSPYSHQCRVAAGIMSVPVVQYRMIRTLVGVLGALSALFPDKIVSLFEKLAIANRSGGTVRGWVRPAIRSEGVLIAAISLLNGRAYAWLMNLTGVFGAIVFLFPDLYRRFATTFLYERPESVEWNERFRSGIRAIGALYVFLAAKTYLERHNGT